MSNLEPFRLTATQAKAKFEANGLTVQEYAQSLLSRIHARDKEVIAWAYLDPEYVFQQALELDKIAPQDRGPLHGIAIGIKDIIYTKDFPTQHGSPIYKGDAPAVDASCVRILRMAGALIFGKTHTAEFGATPVLPPTRNPHDPKRSPGGSSSGSAAAVADLQVPISLGTQTGGSTIRPGSYNGVYAYKPTWSAVSRDGIKIFSLILDTIGFYSRSVEDLQLLTRVFRITDDKQRGFQLKGSKFAAVRSAAWPTIQIGSVVAFEKGKQLLHDHGAEVEEIDLDPEFDQLLRWHDIEMWSSARASFLPEYLHAPDQLDAGITGLLENHDKYTKADVAMALDGMAALRPRFDAFASKFAAILVPTASDEAPEGGSAGNYAFSVSWTSLHVPVVNVPGFKGKHGMPIGLSLVAPRYQDEHLLRVSKEVGAIFESEGGWMRNLP